MTGSINNAGAIGPPTGSDALEEAVRAAADAGGNGNKLNSNNAATAQSDKGGSENTAQAILDSLAMKAGSKLTSPVQNGGVNPIEIASEKSAPFHLATEPGKALGEAARTGQVAAIVADAERAKTEQSAPSRLNTEPGKALGEAARNGAAANNLLAQVNNAEIDPTTKSNAQMTAQSNATSGLVSQTETSTTNNPQSANANITFDTALTSAPATSGELGLSNAPAVASSTFLDVQQPLTGLNSVDQLNANITRAGTPDVNAQIAVQIHRSLAANKSQFSIRLVPAELGAVNVKLDFAKDGSVRALVSVERVETLEMLQRDSHGLERALRDAGVTTEKVNLSFNLQGESKQGKDQQANEGSNAKSNAAPADKSEQESDQASAGPPDVRLNGLIDIHI